MGHHDAGLCFLGLSFLIQLGNHPTSEHQAELLIKTGMGA